MGRVQDARALSCFLRKYELRMHPGTLATKHPPVRPSQQLLTQQAGKASLFVIFQILLDLAAAYGSFVAGSYLSAAASPGGIAGFFTFLLQAGAFFVTGYYLSGTRYRVEEDNLVMSRSGVAKCMVYSTLGASGHASPVRVGGRLSLNHTG